MSGIEDTISKLEVAEKHSPLDQFKIHKIFDFEIAGLDISFTNSSLFMMLSFLSMILFFKLSMKKKSLVPGKFQIIAEGFYSFIRNGLLDVSGKEAKKFVPFVFTVFLFILGCNLLGMIPYGFTATSHIIVNLTLALVVFSLVTVYAIIKKGFFGFLRGFSPSGLPIALIPVIFLMEIVSYLMRPVTLSVRLFANMVAGHVLLKVIAGFVISLGLIGGLLPILFNVVLIAFEVFVAFLQAYIFTLLTSVYISESVKHHH